MSNESQERTQPITEAMRHSLRSKVAHAAEILHAQGPISTFIHTNPLHSLEHLPFHQAVGEAERLLGGQGYLSNDEYRRLFRAGRIAIEDAVVALGAQAEHRGGEVVESRRDARVDETRIRLLHLIYGCDPIDAQHLSYEMHHGGAANRLRGDLPPGIRAQVLQHARTELRLTLDRIGYEWTLAQWVQAHTNIDLAEYVRNQLCHSFRTDEQEGPLLPRQFRRSTANEIERLFRCLGIPGDRRAGYLKCIQQQFFNIGIFATDRFDELSARWLEAEMGALRKVVPRALGCGWTLDAIHDHFEADPEAYAAQTLWHAALAARGLDNPLSGINAVTLAHEDYQDRVALESHAQLERIEADGGLPIPLTAGVRDAIEKKVGGLASRHHRRHVIIEALKRRRDADACEGSLPLTFSIETVRRLHQRPRAHPFSGALLHLLGEIRHRGGFTWEQWDEAMARPLFVWVRPVDDSALRAALLAGFRVRLADDVRAFLKEEFESPLQDQAEEACREAIVDGVREDGLTLAAYEAIQPVLHEWSKADSLTADRLPVEEQLCRTVLMGLRPTELSRSAYQALCQLIDLRGKTGHRRELLAELRQLDPREQMIKTARKILSDKMASLGHDLALSDFLRRLTGLDLTGQVNQYMIRWCAAFLDEGQASWPMPGREKGFYAAWKALAPHDKHWLLTGDWHWTDAVRSLPERPEDVLIATLRTLEIPEGHWSDYLTRRLVQLPGWAGLIKWREHHPRHPRQQQEHIDLVEYLAVRLFCESRLIKQVCRKVWNLDGTARSLHRLFRDHPGEFMVRREYSLGGLPDPLAERARDLIARNPQGPDRDAWVRLAEMIWAHRQSYSHGQGALTAAGRNAWRLFHLAQLLGMTAGEVRSLSVEEADRWLRVLDDFPSSSHGPVWLHAYERHYQQQLLAGLTGNQHRLLLREERPRAQFVLCIDEREESFRRHIEALDAAYETYGTAGFFGVAMQYSGLSGHGTTPLCPVVITPVHQVAEVSSSDEVRRMEDYERGHAWLTFFKKLFASIKTDPIASYVLIDLTGFLLGAIMIGKTVLPRRFAKFLATVLHAVTPKPRTRLQLESEPTQVPPPAGELRRGFVLEEQAGIVEGQLRVMGLTARFARMVLIVGHGSTSYNNPHESAHDCGACGGKHGGPNARALAEMANKPEIRFALRARGVAIPQDTYFVGAQHNTASDGMTYFDTDRIPSTHRHEFDRIVQDMDAARAHNAKERCRLLPMAPKQASSARSLRHMERRSVDFTQVHPEWGHATNASVVVGRRGLTQGLFLDRRTFLQSYDAALDPDGAVLERILTAVVPVAVGIGLEYYFSRVDNLRYGSGTKVPHNVTGLIGVMDGSQSDLRIGLPWQMVWVHEPMRLTFVVESKPAIVQALVQRHRALQKLFDNQWAYLVVLDSRSGDFFWHQPDGQWQRVPAPQRVTVA